MGKIFFLDIMDCWLCLKSGKLFTCTKYESRSEAETARRVANCRTPCDARLFDVSSHVPAYVAQHYVRYQLISEFGDKCVVQYNG